MPLDGDPAKTQDVINTNKVLGYLDAKGMANSLSFWARTAQAARSVDRAEAVLPVVSGRRDAAPRWLTASGVPQIALQTEWPIGTRAEPPSDAIAAYFACVSFTDSNVGSILQALDRHAPWKNTIVVFMSDHGFHLGDHGLWSKKTLFEQTLHVPLIVVLPDGRNAGRTCRRTVQLLDIYPTLADLCGLPAPTDLEGCSLRGLLEDPDAPWERPAYSQVVHEGVVGHPCALTCRVHRMGRRPSGRRAVRPRSRSAGNAQSGKAA